MKINPIHAQILNEILILQTEKKEGIKTLPFRVKFEKHRSDIEYLLKNYLLREEEGRYHITLQGILHLETKDAIEAVDRLNKVLEVLKRLYRNGPEDTHNSETLAHDIDLEHDIVVNDLLFLSDLGIFSSRTGDSYIFSGMIFTLFEKIIDQKPLEVIVNNDQTSKNTAKIEAPQKQIDRWKREQTIGGGGQGQVFLAKDLNTRSNSKYALKTITNENRVYRFSNEVQAIRTLNQKNIVKIIDHNIDSKNSFIVYEFCEGLSLDKNSSFSFEESWNIFFDVCSALAHAHDNGIYHRDIKPANILLRKERSEAVVADFGLCFIEQGERHTEHDEAVGPRNFMAPELEDGKIDNVTGSCDVYSLGKLLYWLLSKGKIFSREKHRNSKYDLVQIYNDDRYEHINRLLDRMLEHNPEKRWSHAGLALIPAKETLRLFEGRFKSSNPINSPNCTYCGNGNYALIADGERSITAVRSFGISPSGTDIFKIFGCSNCGHVQIFRPDLARHSSMWSKQ